MSATKQRILDASAQMLRRQGYSATGLKQIAAAANAPFGSLYHWFPGGKEQLGQEVIRWAGRGYLGLIQAAIGATDDLEDAVRQFFAAAAEVLEATGYCDACPIATVAGEVASTNDTLREATAEVFESWLSALTASAVQAGVDEATGRAVAIQLVALIEGAFILCRASRSTEALHVTGEAAAQTVARALNGRVRPTG